MSGKTPSDKKNRNNKIWGALTVACLCIVIAGGVAFANDALDRIEAKAVYDNLLEEGIADVAQAQEVTPDVQSAVVVSVDAATETETSETEDVLASLGIIVPEKNINWDELHKTNEDIYAWIFVPDTTVDYPMLQHPSDDSFYLNHNADKSKGKPGCIYTEAGYNTKDFTDFNTVVYGHNWRDKSMFTSLHNFEKPELMEKDHYIYVYTPEKTLVYQIFGAYEYRSIHLLDNFNFDNEYVRDQYVKDIFSMDKTGARVANIRRDIEVTGEDRIITLSTCTKDSVNTLRYLVVGVLLNP